MATIITYDLANKHTEVKEAMYALGYANRFYYETKYIYLPNTTLYHEIKTAATSRDELMAVCARLNANLERCVATRFVDWATLG